MGRVGAGPPEVFLCWRAAWPSEALVWEGARSLGHVNGYAWAVLGSLRGVGEASGGVQGDGSGARGVSSAGEEGVLPRSRFGLGQLRTNRVSPYDMSMPTLAFFV